MNSLKFYLKDHFIITVLFTSIYFFGVVYLFISLFRVINGDADYSRIKLLFLAPFFIPAGIYYCGRLKKMLNIIQDIKKEELITEIYYIGSFNYTLCERDHLGAYQNVYCTKKRNDTNKISFWWYKNDLIYPTFDPPGEKYKVIYYKHSKCIYHIERITFNNAKTRKRMIDKCASKKALVDNYQIHLNNNIDGFVIWLFILLIMPILFYCGNKYIPAIEMFKNNYHDALVFFNAVVAPVFMVSLYNTLKHILSYISKKKELCVSVEVATIGIPLEKEYILKGKPIVYYLSFKDKKNKKRKLFFYSTDILELGNLQERSGYKGFGNFIGAKYDVEYYKFSRVIKSMKLISLPEDQSSEGSGGAIRGVF